MSGVKYDQGKERWDLVPFREWEDVVRVLTHGANKYPDDRNWQRVRPFRARYFAAAMRHITRWKRGRVLDEDSGLPHLAHAICCLLFIMWGDNQTGRGR